ncbi:hypothetical protein C0J52_05549 [Blattella germanica]|nr:hypothetical protein C0J52_05549 [Blattella germanica]
MELFLWGNHTSVSKLLVIQKRCVRMICGAQYREHCKPLFVRLGVLTLPSMYILDCLLYFLKENQGCDSFYTVSQILSGEIRHTPKDIAPNHIHLHNTRNRHNLLTPKCRLQKSHSSYIIMGIQLYNKLPLYIRNIQDINIFKRRIKIC